MSLLERSRQDTSYNSGLLLWSLELTEILDIVVEPRGKAQQSSPAAVSWGQLAGAKQGVAETFSSDPTWPHHQAAQYQGQHSPARQSALSWSGSGFGEIISVKALANITSWENTRGFGGHFEKAFCSTSRREDSEEYGTDLCLVLILFDHIDSLKKTSLFIFLRIWKCRMNKICVYISACGDVVSRLRLKQSGSVFFYLIWVAAGHWAGRLQCGRHVGRYSSPH